MKIMSTFKFNSIQFDDTNDYNDNDDMLITNLNNTLL